MVKFINAKFDFEKKVTFSLARVMFLIVVLFSFGIVIGIIWYSSIYKPPKPIELKFPAFPSPTIMPVPVSDNINEWKIYKNEEYGFEVKYPNEWKEPVEQESEGAKEIIFGCPSVDFEGVKHCPLSLNVSDDKNKKEVIKSLVNNLTPYEDGGQGGLIINEGGKPTIKEFVVDGRDAITYHDAGVCIEAYTEIFDSSSDVLFVNRCSLYEGKIFDQIISSFKFIEDNFENSSVSEQDLLGYWFTPHAATRNITFMKNNQFKFKNGSSSSYTGNVVVSGFKVKLIFSDEEMKDIVLKYSEDQNAKYLENDEGELFVKQ